MEKKYEFRSANGRVCCASDNPNHLCPKCKLKLRTSVDAYAKAGTRFESRSAEVDAYYMSLLNETPEECAARLRRENEYIRRHGPADSHVIALALRTWPTKDLKAASARREGDIPDPYASALSKAPYVPSPEDDPRYDPRGVPADPYLIARAVQEVQKQHS